MGQQEVYEFLKKEREKTEGWFTINDIINGLKQNGANCCTLQKNVRDDVFKLVAFKQIEFKGLGIWEHNKVFRCIRKY